MVPITLNPCEHLLAEYAKRYRETSLVQRGLLGLAAANPRVFWILERLWRSNAASHDRDIAFVLAQLRERIRAPNSRYLKFDENWLFASLSGLLVDVTDAVVVERTKNGPLQTALQHEGELDGQPYLPLLSFLLADPRGSLSEQLAFAVVKFAVQRYDGKAYEEFSVAHLALLMEAHAGMCLHCAA
jgi:hypothetical protein